MPASARARLVEAADGDARRLLNLLEVAADLAREEDDGRVVDEAVLAEVLTGERRRFDAGGDVFYDQISRSTGRARIGPGRGPVLVRAHARRWCGSSVCCAPRRAHGQRRRGNADPRALTMALEAWQVQERLGSPEGELAIAHALVWLSCAPKSNAVYAAWNGARKLVEQGAPRRCRCTCATRPRS